ncbi:MAG: GAF domain-containing protein, partial [Anaerolineae bacterium]
RRRLTEMEALHRAGQALLSARLDPEATYTAVHHAVTATMPCEAFAIVLEGEEEYRGVYLYDKGGRVPPRSIPKGQGLSGRVISTGQSVHIRDYSPESDIPAVHVGDPEPVRSILAVPIRQGERTIGMLTAQSYRPDAYDESHRIFLETLATQFAAILENTHLYEQTRARLREVETLYRSAQALSSLMTPQEIGRRLVDIMADHLEWHHVVIRRYNPSDETFDILAYHLPEETIEEQSAEILHHLRDAVPDSRSGLAGRAVREQRSLRVPDVTREAGYVPTFPGIRSGMYVPIRRGKDILGVISVESTRPNAFDEEDERLLNALAHHAAIALENARLYEKTQQQVRRLSMLHTIDSTITSSMDLRLTLNVILEQAIKGLEVDAACVLLYDPAAQTLHFAAGSGFKSDILKDVRLHLGEGYAGRVALERQPLYIAALSRDTGSLARAQRAAGERFVAYAAAPLIAKGEVKGVLEVFRRSPLEYNDEWKQFFQTLAQQAAIAIDSAQLFTSLQRSNIELTIAYDTTIESLVKALELRDKETEGHTKNVAELTIRLARAMGFEEEQLIHVRRGALLHDLGKIAVPDAILHKPGPLTEEEWEIMRRHPQYVYEFLSSIAYLRPALEIPYCHHEKWDGSGYPRGLKGEEIPLAARIFAVADVWDALTSDRPYRKAWPKEKALEYIRQQAGKHFDPQVVEIFLEVIKGRQ